MKRFTAFLAKLRKGNSIPRRSPYSYYERESRETSRLIVIVCIILGILIVAVAALTRGQEPEATCRELAVWEEPFVRPGQDGPLRWAVPVSVPCGTSPSFVPGRLSSARVGWDLVWIEN